MLAFMFIVILIFKVVFINITINANINIYTIFSNSLSRKEGEREARGRHSLSRFLVFLERKKEGESKVRGKPTTLSFLSLERERDGKRRQAMPLSCLPFFEMKDKREW